MASAVIVLCEKCGKPEWFAETKWLGEHRVCRDCYKADWEAKTKREYPWDNLDGVRPTQGEYDKFMAERAVKYITDDAVPGFREAVDNTTVIVGEHTVIKMTGGSK